MSENHSQNCGCKEMAAFEMMKLINEKITDARETDLDPKIRKEYYFSLYRECLAEMSKT